LIHHAKYQKNQSFNKLSIFTALSKNYMNNYQKVLQITLFSIGAIYFTLLCSKSKERYK